MFRFMLTFALLSLATPSSAATTCGDLSKYSQSRVGKFAEAFCAAKTRDASASSLCSKLQVEALKYQCLAAAKRNKAQCKNIDGADPDGIKVCEVFAGTGSCSGVKDSADQGWCKAFDEMKDSYCSKLSSVGLADDCKALIATLTKMKSEQDAPPLERESDIRILEAATPTPTPSVTVTDEDTATEFVTGIMPRISDVVFGGGDAVSGFGLPISPDIRILEDGGINAEQWVAEDMSSNGVAVTRAFLEIENQNAVKFGILHEMGHLLTARFNETLAMELSGYQMEIIADLAAANLMHEDGSSWADVEDAVTTWRVSRIFDEASDGAHPPGDARAAFVQTFIGRMQSDGTFIDVVRGMMTETASYSP